ncbi:hypothetical protein SNEBB_010464 [Seison nebaliae]|nr:hypothetical protein SNEBB_010464 [Seison nebaliae]
MDNQITNSISLRLDCMPNKVRRRINAAKKLAMEFAHKEVAFHKKVHVLEKEFGDEIQSLFNKRADILNGVIDPTDEECEVAEQYSPLKILTEEEDKCQADGFNIDQVRRYNLLMNSENIKGFWMDVLCSHPFTTEFVYHHDIAPLSYLKDIRSIWINEEDLKGFKLEFEFSENPFFENRIMEKFYEKKIDIDPGNELGYDGPRIISSTCCDIKWKPGIRDGVSSKMSSFFQFFEKKTIVEGNDRLAGELINTKEGMKQLEALRTEWFFAEFVRDIIIPKAVQIYTGELKEDSCDEDEDDEDDHYKSDDDSVKTPTIDSDDKEENDESGSGEGIKSDPQTTVDE